MGMMLALLLAVGCSAPALPLPGNATATPTPTTLADTPTTGPTQTQTPASTVPSTPVPLTITVWTVPEFAPSESTEAARLLISQAKAFGEAYPDYRLDWVVKPAAGQGSLVDFLLSAREVAPTILPDIIILPDKDLGRLLTAGLLRPMTGLLSEELRGDLFPFARAQVVQGGEWYALPFAVQIEHAMYNQENLDAPPLTWTDVLSDNLRYAFPAGGQDGQVNDTFLLQYFALGGRFFDQEGNLALDEKALEQVYQFYADGMRASLFPPAALAARSIDEVPALCLNAEADICNVRSTGYLHNRNQWKGMSFATIPTWNGAVATIAHSYAIALVAPDPTRQGAVAAFIEWFNAPERNASWTRAAGFLPARTASLDLWGKEDSYTAFVRWQLQAAFTVPHDAEIDALYIVIQQQLGDVINQAVSPADAASRVAAWLAAQP